MEAQRGPAIFARVARVFYTLAPVCVCARMCMRVIRPYADDSVAERAGPTGARGDEEAHRRSKQRRARQCRPRSGPDGGTRGHIPRWLCLRNAVGAPLRRLPPSFFINRSHLPVLAKRNPLVTARGRAECLSRGTDEPTSHSAIERNGRDKSHRERERDRER